MSTEAKNEKNGRHSPFRNWLSLSGVVLTIASFFSFLLLLVLDALAHSSNPYVGILTYMVAPGFGVMGIGLTLFGIWIGRRRAGKSARLPALHIDFSSPRD